MAVRVQAMVDPTTAGAAFSANPVTGDPEVIVAAVAGHADRLMGGSVTGDEWAVRDGAAHHLGNGDTDNEVVLEIAVLAQRLEGQQGNPVDIEWAENRVLRLLSAHSPASAEPTDAMRRVAETIRRSPAAMASLDAPDGDLVARVVAAAPDCGAAIKDWVHSYGFCDAGGALSHTAVLATANATQRICNGAIITVDGARGTVTPISVPGT